MTARQSKQKPDGPDPQRYMLFSPAAMLYAQIMRSLPMSRWLYWAPPLGWGCLIYYFSSRPVSTATPPWILSNDKFVHALIFGVLSALLCLAFRKGRQWPLLKASVAAFLLSVIYAATDEMHQMFTPERVADPMDWLADVAGSAVVFIALGWSRSNPSPDQATA